MTEIYYIEDDENIAMAVKEYLNRKGYAVSIFGTLESGKEALEYARRRGKQLLPMDTFKMEGTSSYFSDCPR